MHRHARSVVLTGLLAALVLSMMLSGCGAGSTAKATQAPSAGTAPTQASQPVAPAAGKGDATSASGATGDLAGVYDNLIKLAPVHMSSTWTVKVGEEVQSSSSFEADMDANGNQLVNVVNNGDPAEIWIVDKTLYFRIDGDEFMSMGEYEDGGMGILITYGLGYLLAFNDLQDAKKVGSEAVGPWQADKYEIKMDLASLGVSGLVGASQGAEWDYEGTVWIEPSSKAMVKSVVNWRSKDADADPWSWHSEFLASQSSIGEITAPENLVDMG